jgi:4-methylaminobutanoate oxidase (formaldehyde-forming)
VREDARQLSVGFNEKVAKLFGTDGIPEDFSFEQLPPDWDAAMPYFEQAMHRVPVLQNAGVRLFLCGPESVTPDTRYMLGPVPGIANYFVAAGFSGFGIGSSGGAGRALAEWVLEGRPSDDLWEVDVRRMMPFQSNRSYLEQRATEAQGNLFAIAWPQRQYETGRGIRRSPVHEALREARACFGLMAGWEVADWFAPAGNEPKHHYSFGRPNWIPYAQEEAAAAMEAVGLADQSHLSKFLILGPGAEAALAAICAKDPAMPVGGHVLTPLLNARGGIEALVRCIRRTEGEYLMLSESATQCRDLDLLRRRLSGRDDVAVVDVTAAYAAFEVTGPKAEETLRAAGWRPTDGGAAEAEIGQAAALIFAEEQRAPQTWSVVAPTEFAAGLWECLRAAGEAFDVRLVGRHARQFVRTLSQIPIWSQAVVSSLSPIEAGLAALVDLDGDRPFVGRAACERQRRDGVRRRLAAFTLKDPVAVLFGHEPILRHGRLAGAIEQAAYPLGSSCAIGLGYLRAEPGAGSVEFEHGGYEVLVAGRRVPARFEGLVAYASDRESQGATDWATEA